MKPVIITHGKDELIGAAYTLATFSAKELSAYLKKLYSSKGIDYNKFNSDIVDKDHWRYEEGEGKVVKNPPIEIYEYQNFFLMENASGEHILLDGFRRLLWYSAPDVKIYVRIYKQSDLTAQKTLTLLLHLNHFKFLSGDYIARGFGLLLKTAFDLDITQFKSAFDAYLSSDETKSSYSSEMFRGTGTQKNMTVKQRILTPAFISDIKFLETLKNAGCMVNQFFGALLYQLRSKDGDYFFDAIEFVALTKQSAVLQALMVKYEKEGTNSSDKSQKCVNQIMEMYMNIFVQMKGGKVEKSYAERLKDCKDMAAELKKDKGMTKLTGNSKAYLIERIMEDRLKKKEEIKFKCVIYPYKHDNPKVDIGSGQRDDLVAKLVPHRKSFIGTEEVSVGFKEGKDEFTIRHNYGGWNSYGKKYTNAVNRDKIPITKYDIDLFVNIPKSEIPER